jgi:transposase
MEAPSSAYRRGLLAFGQTTFTRGGDLMRFYTKPHQFYCGIDLHTRPMYLGILNQAGEILLHRNMPAGPEPCLKAVAPYRTELVVCVECVLTWYWLADLCARAGIPFVLGHALYLTASHGGKAKHDTIDSQKIPVLLRGGMLPQADVYPAAMRATRDLLRRRWHLTRKRAELLAHVQNPNSQYNLPEFRKQLAYKAHRDGVPERFLDPAVQKTVEVDLALMDDDDQRLNDGELTIVQTAKQPDAQPLYRLQSVPGIGKMLSVVLRDEIPDITRFPRVQDVVSDCRLVKCAKESAGTRYGTSGAKVGNASLTWAFSEAAVLFRRSNPAGQQYLARLERKHGKGKALTVLAHQLARAVDDLLHRDTVFEMHKCLNGSWSGAGEPHASLDAQGLSLTSGALRIALRQRTRRSTEALWP